MSDIGMDTGAPEGASPGLEGGTPPPPPAAESGAPPAPDSAPPPPPWGDKTPEQLWQKNAELIQENAKYKERFRPYEESFSALEPEHAEFFHDLVRAHASRDAGAIRDAVSEIQRAYGLTAAEARQVAAEVTGAQPQQPGQLAQKPVDPRQVAQEEIKKFAEELAVERQKVELAAHAQKIATDPNVGIEEIGQPGHPLNSLLYFMSQQVPNEPNPKARLEKAAQQIREMVEKSGQALVARKAATAGAGPSPAPAEAGAPSGAQKLRTFKQARAAKEEFLRRQAASGQLGT